MANAIAVLDAVRERVGEDLMARVFGRISFFVNAGVRFVEEHAKLRAMGTLWEELGRERYGVTDERLLRFRYGVQVNSLGLTESQPENNVQRIVLEALAVARSSSRRGTRRSASRARGTSSGRCASSRCSPTRPTCSSTPTCSTAPR
jgi:(2R)-ethylmalonyl-CoA mutase